VLSLGWLDLSRAVRTVRCCDRKVEADVVNRDHHMW
jgi:hypothetical protein